MSKSRAEVRRVSLWRTRLAAPKVITNLHTRENGTRLPPVRPSRRVFPRVFPKMIMSCEDDHTPKVITKMIIGMIIFEWAAELV